MKKRNPYDQKIINYLTSKTFRIKMIITVILLCFCCCLLIIAVTPILKEIGIIQIR